MRYGIATGEIALTIFAKVFLGLDLPLLLMLIVPVLAIATNLWLGRTIQSSGGLPATPTAGLLGGVFYFDALCLTLLLMASGGPSNPFTVLYLVHITLAAAILSAKQTWLLGLFSVGCFGLLFPFNHPVPELGNHHTGNLHFVGMWLSFVAAVLLVATYASKISSLLRRHEAASLEMEMELAKKDRVASLVTLAAGAAHELSTPLSTIAVVAKELERTVASPSGMSLAASAAIGEDSRLIRQEVEYCRQILQRMSDEGAEARGEAFVHCPVQDLLSDLASAFPGQVIVPAKTGLLLTLRIPRKAVLQALVGLAKNGIESMTDRPGATVEVHAETGPERNVQFVIRDRGCGMSTDFLRRAGEPFLTTKPPGSGMGLGVFLARNLAERLGGALTYTSEMGRGTAARFELPSSYVVSVSTSDVPLVKK
ncbi:MAG TPA: ATP-binding protein [Bryobacteraceae bacterium]|nr:ATP-binding protein [Bryobacteraceae bacterium]